MRNNNIIHTIDIFVYLLVSKNWYFYFCANPMKRVSYGMNAGTLSFITRGGIFSYDGMIIY